MLQLSAFISLCAILIAFWQGFQHLNNPSKKSLKKIFITLALGFSTYGVIKFIHGDPDGILIAIFGPLVWGTIVLIVSYFLRKTLNLLSKSTIESSTSINSSLPEKNTNHIKNQKISNVWRNLPKQPISDRYKNIDPRIIITHDSKYLVAGEKFGTAYSAEAHIARLDTNKIKIHERHKTPETIYVVKNDFKRIFECKSNNQGMYIIDGDKCFSREQMDESIDWSTFSSLKEATEYLELVVNCAKQNKDQLEAPQSLSTIELDLIKRQRDLLKKFRLRTLDIPTDHLKKIMFAITGNKQFLKKSYDPKSDNMVFSYISEQELSELFREL